MTVSQSFSRFIGHASGVGHTAPSCHMNARKETGNKRTVVARTSRSLKSQLTNRSLRKSTKSIRKFLPGHIVRGWKISAREAAQSAEFVANIVQSVFGAAMTTPKRIVKGKDRIRFIPNGIFAYETVHVIDGESVRILAFLDRDPASVVPQDEEKSSERLVGKRTEDFRQRILESDEMLSGAEVGDLTGMSRQHINNLYRDGKILGLLHPARQRGIRFPRWQFQDGVAGEPIRRVMELLKESDAWDKWLFFTSKDESLFGLTPIEVLTGNPTAIPHSKGAIAMLRENRDARLERVASAAQGYASD